MDKKRAARTLLALLVFAVLTSVIGCKQTSQPETTPPMVFDPKSSLEERVARITSDPIRKNSVVLYERDAGRLQSGEVTGIGKYEGRAIVNQFAKFVADNQKAGDLLPVWLLDADNSRAEVILFKEDGSLQSLVLTRFKGIAEVSAWLPSADSTSAQLLSTLVEKARQDPLRREAGLLCSCNLQMLKTAEVPGIGAEEGESIYAQVIEIGSANAQEGDHMPLLWIDGEAGRVELMVFRSDGQVYSQTLKRTTDQAGKKTWAPEN